MKFLVKVFILIYIILFNLPLKSQEVANIEINQVLVNGKEFDFARDIEVILFDTDSITFMYKVENLDNIKASESFFYRISLKNAKDSSVRTTGSNVASYKNLNENEYIFSVSAFDLKGAWISKTHEITFRVNNTAAKLKRDFDLLKEKSRYQDSLLAVAQGTNTAEGGTNWLYTAIALLVGAVTAAGVVYLLLKNKKEIQIENNTGRRNMSSNPVNQEDFEKITAENSSLKAEIAALRGQIDALQARSGEMSKRNKDLEESIASLTSSKEELENLQKQKDDLFAVIIHDIKNPAALIKSLVELLRSYDLTAVEQQEIIQDIAETTSRIVSLSHEVSKILALEGSRLHLDIQPNQISPIIEDVVRRNSISSNLKNIKLIMEINDNLPDIDIDAQKIDEIIDNLLSNAVKFTQKGGTVRIRSFLENKSVHVEVTDNGLGLSEMDVRNAFQRGSRLSAQPTAGESSTGLGLWIVKKLVEAHNGRVWVKSALGKGSTFAFGIPVNKKSTNDDEKSN